MALPVQVVHGRRDGPTLFVSAAIHGDEVNGVEIIRRLLSVPSLRNLRARCLPYRSSTCTASSPMSVTCRTAAT